MIDGFGPDGIAARVIDVTNRVVRLQTGYLYHYAFAMLIGVAALITWAMFGGAATLMFDCHILTIVTFLPLVGALMICADHDGWRSCQAQCPQCGADHNGGHLRSSRCRSGSISTIRLPGFQMVEKADWIGGFISYHMGVDGISMLFVILTTFLMPLCILASWESIQDRVKEYMIAFLVLETLMIGVFCALDMVLFYVFFEAGLIPMFLIIGIWGGKRRVYASFKFFLYTLLGSVLMLLAMMAMYWQAGTTDIPTLLTHDFPGGNADLAVAGLLRLLRGEDADVAGAHLAARRPRRGADGRFGDPGRRSC